jgi:hypothetical protein
VFSNGNVVIQHQMNEATGKARVLNEDSRYTPEITQDGIIDVGFIGKGRNHFAGITQNALGGTDIFAHDFVLRLPERYTTAYPELELHTIGELALSKFKGGAFSAGPLLNADFLNHPINQDLSLGSHPPFLDSRMARLVLYRTEDGFTHLRLFDGRPSSEVFPGVTPDEARTYVSTDGEVEWGCFLDPGQSARLSVNLGGQIQSYGNSHYVRWPTEDNPNYVWTPENGRPVANLIALY